MPVEERPCSDEEIGRLGEEIYRRDIRPKVMPHDKGRFLILDIHSGGYELDEVSLLADKRLRARRPDGEFYGIRVGYMSAYKLSGSLVEDSAE